MGEWRSLRLQDAAEIFDGPHATPAKTDSGPVFLGISNLHSGRLDLSETEHLSEADWARWTRRVTPTHGDVVFSYETRLGEAAMIPEGFRGCLGRRMGLLRARAGVVDPAFLLYMYLSPGFQDTIRERTVHGSTVDRIPLIEMGLWPISLPPLDEQRAIAQSLMALDKRIDLNRRMNETLEAMARALFKSWFVDFDPVRAKAEGRAPVGMDAATAALFPSRLVQAAEGEAPEGWQIRELGSLVTVTRGRSYTSAELRPSPVALVTLKSFLRGGGYRPDGLKPFIGEFKSEQVVKPGEVVVAFTDVTQAAEVIGKPALVRPASTAETLVASQDTAIVRPHDAELVPFLYYVLMAPRYQEHAYAHTNGSTVLHLHRDGIERFRVAVPPPELVRRFHALASPLLGRQVAADTEGEALVAVRDALLPRLLSGELRIGDAKEPAEEAA